MKFPVLLVACACSLGQITSRTEWQLAPQLAPGLELVYTGTYTEEHLIPRVEFQSQYTLETRVLVLEARSRQWDLALMTSLSQRIPRLDTGVKETKAMSVRLDLGRLEALGNATDPAGATLLLALNGPPTVESGCFVEFPANKKLTKGASWEVNEATRPPRSWQVVGLEAVGGVSCVKLIGQQQSSDWDKPRGDQTAWRRRDVVWVNPQLGVAEKVERVVEHRDPLRRDPTHRAAVQYVLESRLRYPGRLFEDRKQEILKARKFQDEAVTLLRQPQQHHAQVDGLIKKVSLHLENQAPTPYRKAVVHLASRLENAKNGTGAGDPVVEDTPPTPTRVSLGQRVPDFVVNELSGKQSVKLSRLLGRPVLVCFYNPATDLGRDVLQFAKGLVQQHGDKIAVMAMAVTNDTDFALKQQTALQLPFAILDGRGMHVTFGVTDTPRLVLLDSEGVVRSAQTGWATQVPREVQEELQQCLRK